MARNDGLLAAQLLERTHAGQHAGRACKADRRQMTQQRVHRRRPRLDGPVVRVAGAHGPHGPTSGQVLLIVHGLVLAQPVGSRCHGRGQKCPRPFAGRPCCARRERRG